MPSFKITKNEKLPKSEAVIEGELSLEAVSAERKNALNKFQAEVNLDGFRKGHVPEKKLVEVIGELAIFEESASIALEKNYFDIIKEAKVFPLGAPRVSMMKIALGNPVGFKIEISLIPEFTLPEFKSSIKEVKEKAEQVVLEDKDVEDALLEMRRSLAHYEKHHSKEGQDQEHHDHTGKDIPDEELPALDDEFAKKVGNFPTLNVLREKVRENMLNEKEVRAREKTRLHMIEKILEKVEIEVPDVLVQSELNKMTNEFKMSIERMGIKYEEYLGHLKKTQDDLRDEWKDEALKRSKIELVLNKISEDEKIKADEEEVKKESKNILDQYKDADPLRVEIYVETMLTNEKVWQFLENLN